MTAPLPGNTHSHSPPSISAAETLRRIESSRIFQISVIVIIVLSAISIGVKTYELPPLLENILAVLDKGITYFFLCEILVRVVACENRKRFLSEGWNLFDTIIVVGSLIPVDHSEAVLIGRLLRVFRVLRLVSAVPELRVLINALFKAIPRMGYIALLMFIIFYIYGAIGSLFFGEINSALWGDVSVSMLTLFRIATFEDWTDVMYETMVSFPLSWTYYLSFIFLTAFVFLNMMVGTILEVMTAEYNKETAEQAHQERVDLTDKIDQLQRQVNEMHALLRQDRTRSG
jgi:voltage-gated sodium channel